MERILVRKKPVTRQDLERVRALADRLEEGPAARPSSYNMDLAGTPAVLRDLCDEIARVKRRSEEQRQFDLDALKRILEQHEVPTRMLERCSTCDAYRVKAEPCLTCRALLDPGDAS